MDITLDLKGATKSQIERAKQGHLLATAELIGTYQKSDRATRGMWYLIAEAKQIYRR
jgi:hypothetical protein